jgi:hypothetical protein
VSAAREATRAIGLTTRDHWRAMALVGEVASNLEWDDPLFVPNASLTEVGVLPKSGQYRALYIVKSGRVYARPGIAPRWDPVNGTRRGWTSRKL